MSTIDEVLSRRSVIICCGPGGVGKTTSAAGLALAGAILGKRTCVVTIDPARRLADALDVDDISDTPHRINVDCAGAFYAVMLDAKKTFDHLIEQNAKDENQVERIKSNRIYRNLVSALSGTQEYMATEKLYELYESGSFDLIVVDTPPTRFALDFLSAPSRLSGFLDNRIFRMLVTPSRTYLKAFSFASQMLLKTIAKVAGSEIVEDTITFFQAFDGMEEGFKDRAASVEALLKNGSTGFVLIATPRRDAIKETHDFAGHLANSGLSVDTLILNRVLPDFDGAELPSRSDQPEGAWKELSDNLLDLIQAARAEGQLLAELGEAIGEAPVLKIPLLPLDVHDLEGLRGLVRHLLERELP